MVDQIEKGSELTSKTVLADGTMNPAARACVECGATQTPLWRGGPAGPKSLCNACGIRSRKRKGALLGSSKKEEKKKSKKPRKNSNSNVSTVTSAGSSSNNSQGNNKKGDSPKKRPESPVFVPREEVLNEVEAAMLLMAMSYDTPFSV